MFNFKRLELARKKRGLTITALAESLGVTSRWISELEHGRQAPTEGLLEKLADALEFPVAFFERDDPDLLTPAAASFRALSKMPAATRDSALASGALAFELAAYLEQWVEIPRPEIPDLGDLEPEDAAEALRAQWQIGDSRPIRNMIHLLEAKGVWVFSLADSCREVDAFSTWNGERPFVFANTRKTGERRRFDAAHELGHLVLDHYGSPRRRSPEHTVVERRADAFASAFLMPRAAIRASGIREPNMQTLIARKSEWRVSVLALLYRLHFLGLVNDWRYRMLNIEARERGYHRQEPNPMATPEVSLVLPNTFAILAQDGQRRTAIADALGIRPDDLDGLVFDLVPTAVPGVGSGPSSPSRGRLSRVP